MSTDLAGSARIVAMQSPRTIVSSGSTGGADTASAPVPAPVATRVIAAPCGRLTLSITGIVSP